jgi:predicted O-methyltransferase YrrM
MTSFRNKYDFINLEKKENIEKNITETKKFINEYLLPIIKSTGEKLEGNIFMLDENMIYTNIFFDKQVNFVLASSKENINNVLEIGFNAGFSALLMLISNPNLKITCVDICSHKYALLCFNKMKEKFGDRINILCGSSVDVLPKLIGNQYDMIHIDGCHLVDIAELDIKNSLQLCKSGTILIMDDTNDIKLLNIWLRYSNSHKLLNFYKGNFVDSEFHNIKVYP